MYKKNCFPGGSILLKVHQHGRQLLCCFNPQGLSENALYYIFCFSIQTAASIDMNFQSDIMASFENTIG